MYSKTPALLLVIALLVPSSAWGDGADADEVSSNGPVVGLELGLGVPAGDSGVFGAGLGRSFMFGWHWDQWSVEWRFAESYDVDIDYDTEAVIDGQLSVASLLMRRSFNIGTPRLIPELALGGVSLSAPILVAGGDGYYIADVRHGVGVTVAGGVLVPLSSGVFLSLDVRAHFVRFEGVGSAVVESFENDMATTTVDPAGGTPMSATVGFRLPL